jgi:hypothetical protein
MSYARHNQDNSDEFVHLCRPMSGASKFEGTTLINIIKLLSGKRDVHYLFFVNQSCAMSQRSIDIGSYFMHPQ